MERIRSPFGQAQITNRTTGAAPLIYAALQRERSKNQVVPSITATFGVSCAMKGNWISYPLLGIRH